ncbi:conserved domain protein [Rhodobacterales bacterium Y4I]|nr:conserved domain protein [Rhodobacterales bacterium Y4I]
MSQNKTVPTGASVEAFLAGVEPARKAAEAQQLDALFRRTTGYAPQMWGPSLVGYGRYHYRYATGREGDFLATGFAPQKARHSIHIMPGYQDYGAILSRLGKHKLGKSCLYVNKLDDIDLEVLAELIRAGLRDLNEIWPVQPA